MARRDGEPLYGARYCRNTNTTEVHDLGNEQVQCQIDEIILAGHAIPFDTLEQAHQAGYDNCPYCIGVPAKVGENPG